MGDTGKDKRNFMLTHEVSEKLDEMGERTGMTYSAIVEYCLREHIDGLNEYAVPHQVRNDEKESSGLLASLRGGD